MKIPILITALLVAGCSATYKEPALPADHPANTGAAEAPPAERSRTLDIAAAEPVAPAPGAGGAATHAADHSDHESMTPAASPEGSGTRAHDSGEPAGVVYACPMHPEVTSDKPDQRCPKCRMKLKKVDGGKQP